MTGLASRSQDEPSITEAILIDKVLYLSRFAHFYFRSPTVALYHSLKNAVVFTDGRTLPFIEAFRDGKSPKDVLEGVPRAYRNEVVQTLAKLRDMHYLLSDPRLELDALENTRRDLLSEPKIDLLYLLLTDKCNFACTYCFINGGIPPGYRHSVMDEQTAKNAIDLFAASTLASDYEHCSKSIIIYGGEPLLNFATLRFVLDYVSGHREIGKLPEKTSVDIITNGSLITSQIAEVIRGYSNVNVSVSLDGPEHIHDSCRVYHDGRGTFNDVVRGFHLLKDAGISVSVSCTLHRHNVDVLPEVAHWLITECGVKALGFNLLNDSLDVPQVPEEFTTQSAQQLIRAFEVCRKYGVFEDRMMRKVSDFVHQRLRVNDCGGCGGQFVVAPDGALGVCHGYLGTREHFVHNVNSSVGFNPRENPVFLEWRSRSPLNMSQCAACPALGMCGGGCPHDAEIRSGSIWGLDERFCIHSKITLEWLIWDLHDKIDRNPLHKTKTKKSPKKQKGGGELVKTAAGLVAAGALTEVGKEVANVLLPKVQELATELQTVVPEVIRHMPWISICASCACTDTCLDQLGIEPQEKTSDTATPIRGNPNSRIYHLPGQAYYGRAGVNVRLFASEEEAIAAGYRKSLR